MIECYRLLVARLEQEGPDWNYPIHLGVTEAGEGEDGRIKSAIASVRCCATAWATRFASRSRRTVRVKSKFAPICWRRSLRSQLNG